MGDVEVIRGLPTSGTSGFARIREVHVVVGSQGEYSDRDEWGVRAFLDEREAQQFADAASAEARALYAHKTEIERRAAAQSHALPVDSRSLEAHKTRRERLAALKSQHDPRLCFSGLRGSFPPNDYIVWTVPLS